MTIVVQLYCFTVDQLLGFVYQSQVIAFWFPGHPDSPPYTAVKVVNPSPVWE